MRSIRRHHSRKQFASRLEGKKMTGVERRGKYILVQLEGGEVLVIHLGHVGPAASGRRARASRWPKHTHVVITFTQGGQLRFIDPRTFGEMFVTELDDVENEVDRARAPRASTRSRPRCRGTAFGRLVAAKHTKLKPLLMDQKFLAGIGNIYSDEILWGAGLRWDRMSDSLSPEEIRRLYRAMRRDRCRTR